MQANACKERIQVAFDNGKFEGWLIDWSGRGEVATETELLELDMAKLQPSPSHLIIYDPDDDGHSDITAIQMGKNGWLTDPDGDKHRCKLLGSKEFIDDKQNNNRCDKCSVVFRSERALKSHRAGKCRTRQDMTAEEQAKLRRKGKLTRALRTARFSVVDTWQTTSSCCAIQVPGNDGLYGRSFDKRN